MKYTAPIDAADPDDPYIDGNPGTGTEGSAVPAAAIEHPQREIVAVIEAAGLTPDEGDLTQLLDAISALITAGTATARVGTVQETYQTAAQTGWLMMNDQTIGNAGSGATDASALYVNLYALLWNNVSDTDCPVTGGRGANAAADWAANKPLRLPLRKGRSSIGAGTGSGLTARNLGSAGGEESHTPITSEMASHTHTGKYTSNYTTGGGNTGLSRLSSGGSTETITDSAGSGNPFNVMHPFSAINYEIKY